MRKHLALCLALAALAVPAEAQRSASAPEVVAYLEPGMVGVWDVWIPGAVQYHTDGRTVEQSYSPGAAMNRLEIQPDGGYRWGTKQGALVPAKPWFGQPGVRYLEVEHEQFGKYILTYQAGDDRLVVLFDVGGHAASGTRVGGQRPSAPRPERGATTADASAAPASDNPLGVSWMGGGPSQPAPSPAPSPVPRPTDGGGSANPLGVEWAGGSSSRPPAPSPQPEPRPTTGGGLGVEWRTGTGVTGGSAPAPTPPPTSGGLGVEWRTGTQGGSTGAGGSPPPPPPPTGDGSTGGGSPPLPTGGGTGGGAGETWPGGGGTDPVEACTTARDIPEPSAPAPLRSDYSLVPARDVGSFESGYSVGFSAGWRQLATGQRSQPPTFGGGQTTSDAYNGGWLKGFARAQQVWQRVSLELARECAARQRRAPGDGSQPTSDNPLAGVWGYEAVAYHSATGGTISETSSIGGSLAFDADGTFNQELTIGQFLSHFKGGYRLEGSTLVRTYRWGPREETERLEVSVSGDRLTLRGPKYVHTLRRLR